MSALARSPRSAAARPLMPALPAELRPDPFGRKQLETIAAALQRRGDSANTRRNYAGDLRRFLAWLVEQDLSPHEASADDLDRYREYLREPVDTDGLPAKDGSARYSVASANRALVVVRLFYAEAHRRGWLWLNPAAWLRSVRGGSQEGHYPSLTMAQVRELMSQLDAAAVSTEKHAQLSGLRDRLVLHLGIRNGLRREEIAAIRVRDLGENRGYAVLTVRGKGSKRRRAKLQPDTARAVQAWIKAARLEPDDPLFVPIAKGGRLPKRQAKPSAVKLARGQSSAASRLPLPAMSGEAVREIVRRRLVGIGITDPLFSTHALRATFATLALEGNAKLQKVQRAMGHARPDTTERYDRGRDDLDDNASDYIRI